MESQTDSRYEKPQNRNPLRMKPNHSQGVQKFRGVEPFVLLALLNLAAFDALLMLLKLHHGYTKIIFVMSLHFLFLQYNIRQQIYSFANG